MATESTTTKKTTTRKTTTKPKTEVKSDPVIDVENLQQQMQQMMQLMAQQQQVIASLTQNQVEQKDAVVKQDKVEKQLTKQYLRRNYKDTEVYLQNVTHGIVSYKCRDGVDVVWNGFGDVQTVAVDDILAMDSKFLQTPWLIVDDYENEEEITYELCEVLKLENPTLRYKTLSKLEENINEVDIDEIKQMLSKSKDGSLVLDVCACVQQKIKSGELESYKRIEQFEKLVGRKFEM